MLPFATPAVALLPASAAQRLSLLSPTNTVMDVPPAALMLSAQLVAPTPTTTPVLEVVKVYGKLAGSSCYGRVAPKGSSCQVSSTEVKESLGLLTSTDQLNELEFRDKLRGMSFQWPLKPYGIDKSLDKTAVMNKGAETRLYMEQLQEQGLYDPRNPAMGPLPTSLRPQMNAILQELGMDLTSVSQLFDRLKDSKANAVTAASLETNLFRNRGTIDCYDFISCLGPESISWK
jgi:hypothetical protein